MFTLNPEKQFYFPLLFLLCLTGLGLVLPGDASPREGKDFALFIAIDEYDNWQDLNNPVRDAEAVAEDLRTNFGFETEILRNPTELEILRKLNEYVRSDYRENDQLLIFFSGHGHLIRTSKEGFIIPKDALSITDDPYGSSFIPHDRLRNIVASIPCHHVLLILDSCFSGTFDQRIVRGEQNPTDLDGVIRLNPDDFEKRSLLYLTAGGDEYVDDGEKHSPFASAFLLALRNFGDIDSDGIISFLELCAFVQNSVEGQKPTAGNFKEHEGGDFYLVRNGWQPHEDPSPGISKGYREINYATTSFTSIGDLTLSPDWSPNGEWIAYASNMNGDMDIWKKRSDGGKAERLTKMKGNEIHPAWSPDGKYIAFSSDQPGGGLMVMSAEGGEPSLLTPFGNTPRWSPDGKMLVFESNGNVYLVDAAGVKVRQLVRGTSADPFPIWTTNGRFILYWNRTLGDIYRLDMESGDNKPLSLVPAGQEIGSLDLNPGGDRLLFSRGTFGGNKNLYEVLVDTATFFPVTEERQVAITTTDDIEGAFSPDCECIAFTARNVERHLYSIPLNAKTGLAAGKHQPLTRYGRLNYYPAFSPDGHTLLWTSHRSGQGNLYIQDVDVPDAEAQKLTSEWGSEVREISGCFDTRQNRIFFASTLSGSYQLCQVPAAGSTSLPITQTQHPDRDVHPSLSPDGQTLVFYSNRSGSWDIWTLSVAPNSVPQRLTDWPGNELYPCWSPDGRKVAFQSDRNGNADIWLLDLESGNAEPLVIDPAEETWSAWTPDGRWFFFASNRDGHFNIWRIPAQGGEAEAVTDFKDMAFGLPESGLYAKFALSNDRLVLPLEERKGDVFLLREVK